MESERKFGLAREAVEQSLRMLRPEDRFSLVVYDTEIDVLTPSTRATSGAQRRALDALRAVGPRGGTDLGGGWLRGCEQVAEFLDRESVSRCLLLTDGLANHGITDRDALASHASELRRRGVTTTTFGVGADFDERLLRDMAHEGGGNFYFIEGATQIPEMLTSELGEALEITLRDVTLVLSLTGAAGAAENGPPRERAAPRTLNKFKHSFDGKKLVVELGDLTSGQELDVVLSVEFPRGEIGNTASVGFELHSQGERVAAEASAPRWTYASHAENDAQPRDLEVDRAVAAIYAARARAEATKANRERLRPGGAGHRRHREADPRMLGERSRTAARRARAGRGDDDVHRGADVEDGDQEVDVHGGVGVEGPGRARPGAQEQQAHERERQPFTRSMN